MVWGNEDIESTVVECLRTATCWATAEAAEEVRIHIEAGSGLATQWSSDVKDRQRNERECRRRSSIVSIVAISALEYRAVESLRKKLHDYEEEVDLIGNRAKKE